MSCSSPQPPPAPASLLHLPPELLRLVWDHLRVPPGPDKHDTRARVVARAAHQHALRCACMQLRDATTGFLRVASVAFHQRPQWRKGAPPPPPPTDEETLACALIQLAAFPAAATPTALRWAYEDGSSYSFTSDVDKRPGLLPGFFSAARERLAGVESVTVEASLALRAEQLSSLVHACPRLRSLALRDAPVSGPGLAALSRLSGLQELSLTSVYPCPKPASTQAPDENYYQALSLLSTLTKLEALELCLEKLLPHLSGLTSLRDLALLSAEQAAVDQRCSDAALSHLGPLTQLTALTVELCPPGCSRLPQEGLLGSGLALPPTLVHLHLQGWTLDAAAIRLVASLPSLVELSAAELDPDRDLSGLACAYTKLSLLRCPCAQQFTWLPLASVKLLAVEEGIDWWAGATLAELVSPPLLQACQILARTSSRLHLSVRLSFDYYPVLLRF